MDAPVSANCRSFANVRAWTHVRGTSYGLGGNLVGLTILNARRRLVEEGKIVLTFPEQRVEARDLDDVLTPA